MRKKLLAALALTAMLSGCGVMPVDKRFEAGVYRGSAEGYNGPVTVEVETDSRYIRSIQVIDHYETAVMADPVIRDIPVAILLRQSLDVDIISGCTITSRAVIDAVGAALAEGSIDRSVLPPLRREAPVMARTLSYEADVVIIGAGGAGLSAGVEALRAGASVIVLEKQPVAGGSTILRALGYDQPGSPEQQIFTLTPAERAAIREIIARDITADRPGRWQQAVADQYADYVADEEADYLMDGLSLFKLQIYLRSDRRADPELIEVLGNNLKAGRVFLEELDVRWTGGARARVGGGWRRSLLPNPAWGSAGEAFVLPQLTAITWQGGEVFYNMAAESLMMEDGRVTGVRGSCEGVAFEVRARRGVILATGGYTANKALIASHNLTWPNLEEMKTVGTPSATGDGLVMAMAVGAALTESGDMIVTPIAEAGEALRIIDNLLLINQEGMRFVREDAPAGEIATALMQQQGTVWAVSGGSTLTARQAAAYIESGDLLWAETLPELARLMGVPGEALAETAASFNRAARTGGDEWGRAVFGEALAPPYYASKVDVALTGTGRGLMIDTQARVLNAAGEPIPGLWAAGEVTGGLSGYTGPQALVFGRIAGKGAAA